jgi:DNA-binding MarR family transcriptional regulator
MYITPHERSIGAILGITYRRMSQLLMNRLKDYDITPEQWSVLHQIYREEGLNQKEIALRSAKDQPTTARLMDVLDRKGWARRAPSAQDRRAYLLYLTDEGRTLMEETLPIEKQISSEFLKGIDERDFEHFMNILRQIQANITELEQQGETQ